MFIKKSVITAASPTQRSLPMQTLVDRDGVRKSALQILVEEALSAGVNDIGIVIAPGDDATYAQALSAYRNHITFIPQDQPRGYGYALYCAKAFVGADPFLHLVSDHLPISQKNNGNTTAKTCAQQLVDIAKANECAVSAVQATREAFLPNYGAIGGKRVAGQSGLYQVDQVLEKPSPTEAEQKLWVSGLRAGHFLCFFGMHVLPAVIMQLLEGQMQSSQPIQLSSALAILAQRERYLAYEVQGRRYDIGPTYGLLNAQLALALNGKDRDMVLTQLVELLAG